MIRERIARFFLGGRHCFAYPEYVLSTKAQPVGFAVENSGTPELQPIDVSKPEPASSIPLPC